MKDRRIRADWGVWKREIVHWECKSGSKLGLNWYSSRKIFEGCFLRLDKEAPTR